MREKQSPNKKILKLQSIIDNSYKKPVPELRLRGRWLESNGFHGEEYVEITYGYEYLVIYPHKNEES